MHINPPRADLGGARWVSSTDKMFVVASAGGQLFYRNVTLPSSSTGRRLLQAGSGQVSWMPCGSCFESYVKHVQHVLVQKHASPERSPIIQASCASTGPQDWLPLGSPPGSVTFPYGSSVLLSEGPTRIEVFACGR